MTEKVKTVEVKIATWKALGTLKLNWELSDLDKVIRRLLSNEDGMNNAEKITNEIMALGDPLDTKAIDALKRSALQWLEDRKKQEAFK